MWKCDSSAVMSLNIQNRMYEAATQFNVKATVETGLEIYLLSAIVSKD